MYNEAKHLESMTISWIVSRIPCPYWTLANITGKPQWSGWHTAWAQAAQTDACIPQLKNSEQFYNSL